MNWSNKTFNVKMTFLIIILYSSSVFADRQLKIDPVIQTYENWCWATCCEMILWAYKYNVTEFEIADWAVGGDTTATNKFIGSDKTVDKILMHFGKIESNHTPSNSDGYGNLSPKDLIIEIDTGRPVIAMQLGMVEDTGHALLIIGYEGYPPANVEKVIYNDPASGRTDKLSYARFVQSGISRRWRETLRLTTNPVDPIPIGIGPGEAVRIKSGTMEITESTQQVTFTAKKYGPHTPVTWNWKLYFTHKEGNGNCLVASWSENSSAFESTWNIENFSLPTGYKWNYNYDGKIVGRVEVSVYDDESPPTHDHNLNVYFVPDDLYPGYLLYENKTVSDAQPDVRAHYRIVLNNVEFLPGADIDFKAGEQIEMGNNVEIESGSKTDFIVDPSLQNY